MKKCDHTLWEWQLSHSNTSHPWEDERDTLKRERYALEREVALMQAWQRRLREGREQLKKEREAFEEEKQAFKLLQAMARKDRE